MFSSKILRHVVVENLSHVVVEQRRAWIVNVDYGEAWINNVKQRRTWIVNVELVNPGGHGFDARLWQLVLHSHIKSQLNGEKPGVPYYCFLRLVRVVFGAEI